jgi:hypothetical protein
MDGMEDLSGWAERRIDDKTGQAAKAAKTMPPEVDDVLDDGDDEGAEGEKRYAPLIDLLAQDENAAFVEGVAAESRDDLVNANPEPSPETVAKIEGDVERMPEGLREGFKNWATSESPLEFEEAQELAGDIAAKREIADPEAFGAWLYHASKALAGLASADEAAGDEVEADAEGAEVEGEVVPAAEGNY